MTINPKWRGCLKWVGVVGCEGINPGFIWKDRAMNCMLCANCLTEKNGNICSFVMLEIGRQVFLIIS